MAKRRRSNTNPNEAILVWNIEEAKKAVKKLGGYPVQVRPSGRAGLVAMSSNGWDLRRHVSGAIFDSPFETASISKVKTPAGPKHCLAGG